MSVVEQDILSTPHVLRQAVARVEEQGEALARLLQGEVVFLGTGSSYCVAALAAQLYEETRGAPAQGILASEYRPRKSWAHLAISRTGKTTELVEAMQRARGAGAAVGLIVGDPGSPAERHAATVLPMEFAPEEGVIQTRFISAAILALRILMGGNRSPHDVRSVPDQVERTLADFDPSGYTRFDHVVFLGRRWRYGLALLGALNLQETALVVPEGHQTLDYRHGPMASADENTLVWCFDSPDDSMSAAVVDDVRQTGATVYWPDIDPLASLVQAQLLSVRIAESRGINPDAPRHLTRAVVLPDGK